LATKAGIKMADRTYIIQIGDRIINLAIIPFIQIDDGHTIVNVHLPTGTVEQFTDEEAKALIAALRGYVFDITPR
jgi:hypothetical protein